MNYDQTAEQSYQDRLDREEELAEAIEEKHQELVHQFLATWENMDFSSPKRTQHLTCVDYYNDSKSSGTTSIQEAILDALHSESYVEEMMKIILTTASGMGARYASEVFMNALANDYATIHAEDLVLLERA